MRSGKYDPSAAVAQLPGTLPPRAATDAKLVVDHADDIARGPQRRARRASRRRGVACSPISTARRRSSSLGALTPGRPPRDAKLATALDAIGQAIEPAVTAQLDERRSQGPRARGLGAREARRRHRAGADAAIAKALGRPGRSGPRRGDERGRRARGPRAAPRRRSWSPRSSRRSAAPAGAIAASPRSRSAGSAPHGDRRRAAKAAGDASSFVREAVAHRARPATPGARAAARAVARRGPAGPRRRRRRARSLRDDARSAAASWPPTPTRHVRAQPAAVVDALREPCRRR